MFRARGALALTRNHALILLGACAVAALPVYGFVVSRAPRLSAGPTMSARIVTRAKTTGEARCEGFRLAGDALLFRSLRRGDPMPITQLNPYLNFNGTAASAIKLYESALGAKVENVQRFGDAPDMGAGPEAKDRVIHATLRIGSGVIMMSDTMPNMPPPAGNNVHVSLNFDDVADMRKKFEALSAGGKVTMAPQDTFWGATFGMLTDAFGINWMFNCEKKK
jgi:PhnB protein